MTPLLKVPLLGPFPHGAPRDTQKPPAASDAHPRSDQVDEESTDRGAYVPPALSSGADPFATLARRLDVCLNLTRQARDGKDGKAPSGDLPGRTWDVDALVQDWRRAINPPDIDCSTLDPDLLLNMPPQAWSAVADAAKAVSPGTDVTRIRLPPRLSKLPIGRLGLFPTLRVLDVPEPCPTVLKQGVLKLTGLGKDVHVRIDLPLGCTQVVAEGQTTQHLSEAFRAGARDALRARGMVVLEDIGKGSVTALDAFLKALGRSPLPAEDKRALLLEGDFANMALHQALNVSPCVAAVESLAHEVLGASYLSEHDRLAILTGRGAIDPEGRRTYGAEPLAMALLAGHSARRSTVAAFLRVLVLRCSSNALLGRVLAMAPPAPRTEGAPRHKLHEIARSVERGHVEGGARPLLGIQEAARYLDAAGRGTLWPTQLLLACRDKDAWRDAMRCLAPVEVRELVDKTFCKLASGTLQDLRQALLGALELLPIGGPWVEAVRGALPPSGQDVLVNALMSAETIGPRAKLDLLSIPHAMVDRQGAASAIHERLTHLLPLLTAKERSVYMRKEERRAKGEPFQSAAAYAWSQSRHDVVAAMACALVEKMSATDAEALSVKLWGEPLEVVVGRCHGKQGTESWLARLRAARAALAPAATGVDVERPSAADFSSVRSAVKDGKDGKHDGGLGRARSVYVWDGKHGKPVPVGPTSTQGTGAQDETPVVPKGVPAVPGPLAGKRGTSRGKPDCVVS